MTWRTFRTIQKLIAPRWLTDEDGELVGYSLGIMLDAFVERCRLGLLARFPQAGPNGETAPTDALAAMGRDRRIIRGLFETDAEYAVRLKAWLDDHPKRGNPWALLQKLAEYTGPGPAFRTVDARGNWWSRDADGVESVLIGEENWDWDGAPEQWSRFWVIIYPNGLWTDTGLDWGAVDAPAWGEAPGTTWGSTATPEHVASVRAIIAEWMPAGTRCVNVVIAFDPASFDPAAPEPDGLWARWGKNVDGVYVRSRLATARYWDGVRR